MKVERLTFFDVVHNGGSVLPNLKFGGPTLALEIDRFNVVSSLFLVRRKQREELLGQGSICIYRQ